MEKLPRLTVPSWAKLIAVALVGLFVVSASGLFSAFGYVNYPVDAKEVGIRFEGNRPVEVVPAGVYTKIGFFQKMQTVSTEGLPFEASDEEVVTKDSQRIGVSVAGSVLRPGGRNPQELLDKWGTYGSLYTDDGLLVGRKDRDGKVVTSGLMQSLSQQAMKVCVGDLDFEKAAVGSARDVLRECIDRELDKLAKGYGLEVTNIVVPNIVLSNAVKANLDAITEARLKTTVAEQQKLQVKAESERTLATEQGKILVEQGRVQEKAKQDAATAELEQRAQAAQYAVIEAKKRNERFEAEQDLLISREKRKIAEEQASAALAPKVAEAAIFQTNPEYASVVKTQAVAQAYTNTDKVIVPLGTNPTLVVTGGTDAARPVVQTVAQAATPAQPTPTAPAKP